MQKGINNIHDKFFKKYLSEHIIAIDFLKTFLPSSVLDEIDISSVQLSKDSYISSELNESFSDIIFLCKNNKSKPIRISIIIEHKSYIDKRIYLQLLLYIVNGYLFQEKSKEPLHPIVTMIFYHGKERWKPKLMKDLFLDLPKSIKPFIPTFETVFINLNEFSDEQLQSIGNSFLTAALLLQKYSFNPNKLIKKADQIFATLESESKRNLIKPIFVYFLNITRIDITEMNKIIEQIPPSLKCTFMSTYENIREEGLKLGLEKGLEQGLEKGLEQGQKKKIVEVILTGISKGFSEEDMSKITGISKEHIQRIINKHSL